MTLSIRWVDRPLPFEDESLTSFLRRWAQGNVFNNRSQLLKALELSSAVRMDAFTLEHLSKALGVDVGKLLVIAPNVVPRHPALRSFLTRSCDEAVCPQCLVENGYSRQLWSHALATACPRHGVRLTDRCPDCGGSFGHNRSSALMCACGMDLRRIQTQAADPMECEFARLLQGEKATSSSLPFLVDGEAVPPNIDLFMLGLANHFCHPAPGVRLEKRGKRFIPRSVEQTRARLAPVFRLLGQWPTRLSDRINELIAGPSTIASSGVAKRLGSWYRFLFKEFTDPAYDAVRVVAANCIAQGHDGVLNARTRNVLLLATVAKDWYSIAECERELGVSVERINSAIDRGWLNASKHEQAAGYRERFLPRCEIERIRSLKQTYVDPSEAKKFLDVPESVLAFMVEAKLIEVGPAECTWTGSGDLDRASILGLIERLKREGGKAIDPDCASDVVFLRDLGLRRTTDRSKLIGAYKDIASGALRPIGWDGSSGIGGIAFCAGEVSQRVSSRFLAGHSLTLQQVADLTGSHYDAVRGWAESGFLRANRPDGETASPWGVEIRALVEFLMTFTPLAHHAKDLGSSTRGLRARLASRSIHPVNPDADRGTVFRLSDVLLAASGIGQRVEETLAG